MIGAIVRLAAASLWDRKLSTLLTLAAITLGSALLLTVDTLRTSARAGFDQTISGAHLIVGARTSPINLLLHSVLRIGVPSDNMSIGAYRRIAAAPLVAWAIPIASGDTHRGFPVIGTATGYFRHYRFGDGARLRFVAGRPFANDGEAVIGAQVARVLGYRLGDQIVLQHGTGDIGLAHDDHPVRIVGKMAATGTPVDRTLHVTLAGLRTMHGGSAFRSIEALAQGEDEERAIGAVIVALKVPVGVFQMQRTIAADREALTAIIPGLALAELWATTRTMEQAFLLLTMFVALVAMLGMLIGLVAGLNDRRGEIALLRAIGMGPVHVGAMLLAEALVLSTVGAVLGVALTFAGLRLLVPLIAEQYGVLLVIGGLERRQALAISAIVASSVVIAMLPAWIAYRRATGARPA